MAAPDLVLGYGVEWTGPDVCLAWTWECGGTVAGIQATTPPSEVWAASGVLFE